MRDLCHAPNAMITTLRLQCECDTIIMCPIFCYFYAFYNLYIVKNKSKYEFDYKNIVFYLS